jgi:Kdo2-lipid IVA lauroyltransferase/acyltransferase
MKLATLARNFDFAVVLPAIARLPGSMALFLARRRGDLYYLLRSEARRAGIRNMARAFPGMGEREIRRKVRRSFWALSRDEFDSYWLDRPLSKLDGWVRLSGLETLRSALASGRGVLFYTGHLGSTGLLITVLGKREIPLNLVFRRVEDIPEMPGAWYRYGAMRVARLQTAAGRPVLAAGRGDYFAMRRRLREGEIVLMGIDVIPRFVNRTIPVRIFGLPARFPDGIARLYLDTGARVLFWSMHEVRGGRHEAEIFDVTSRVEGLTDRRAITQELVAVLEDRIRRHPEDWLEWEAFHEYLVSDADVDSARFGPPGETFG